jgi:hypothetical protein
MAWPRPPPSHGHVNTVAAAADGDGSRYSTAEAVEKYSTPVLEVVDDEDVDVDEERM